ncbi:MAG: F0F1 ATP synthase subunit alpha [Candidatus Hermodarchaeia archaeon]|jgi:F-type H+-transporting ATPase subunit alpha
MKDFGYYLDKVGEIGFVDRIIHSIVYVSGLPKARPFELVILESGELGQVMSLSEKLAEILLLTHSRVRVGTKVVRTDEMLQVPVGDAVLGRVIDSLVNPIDTLKPIAATKLSPVDVSPHGIVGRKQITKPLETGVTLIDLAVPLGKGQRELVIGDRKTGKTEFLLQALLSQAKRGAICIYAIIGQRLIDIRKRAEFLKENNIFESCVIVATSSSDPSGLIFQTPYTAMTIAEFFRDQNRDVLLILDDMTTHARYYREMSLLARRFPGKNSYPGDIFYAQARLVERAGNYVKGSITCLPVAESILGDLSGYIQTNLMAMTDGHIFFDIELYNQGKRPAVSPFLSVTRVGHQTQTPLLRDISHQLSSFLVQYQKMKQFTHFGAEAGGAVKKILGLGEKVDVFFSQLPNTIIPLDINVVILAGLWAGIWNEIESEKFKGDIEQLIVGYQEDDQFKEQVKQLISSKNFFSDLINALRLNKEILTARIK